MRQRREIQQSNNLFSASISRPAQAHSTLPGHNLQGCSLISNAWRPMSRSNAVCLTGTPPEVGLKGCPLSTKKGTPRASCTESASSSPDKNRQSPAPVYGRHAAIAARKSAMVATSLPAAGLSRTGEKPNAKQPLGRVLEPSYKGIEGFFSNISGGYGGSLMIFLNKPSKCPAYENRKRTVAPAKGDFPNTFCLVPS